MNLYEKALIFAIKKYGDQKYGNHPYLVHLIDVASRVSVEIKPEAILHDIFEGTDTTVMELLEAGFSKETIRIISAVTRPKDVAYLEYIRSIKDCVSWSPYALEIKIADLKSNLEHRPPEHLEERYRIALDILEGKRE